MKIGHLSQLKLREDITTYSILYKGGGAEYCWERMQSHVSMSCALQCPPPTPTLQEFGFSEIASGAM